MILEVQLLGGAFDGLSVLRRSLPPRIAWVSERDVRHDRLKLHREPASGRLMYYWPGNILANPGGRAPLVKLEHHRDAALCSDCGALALPTEKHGACALCGGSLLPASIPVTA